MGPPGFSGSPGSPGPKGDPGPPGFQGTVMLCHIVFKRNQIVNSKTQIESLNGYKDLWKRIEFP